MKLSKRTALIVCSDGKRRCVPRVRTLDEVISDIAALTQKGGPDDCWLWMGAVQSKEAPYGNIRWKGKLILVHRFVYQVENKINLVHDQFVLHKCDNPRCVNPKHLFLGSQLDNMRDMFNKNRRLRWPSEILKAQLNGITNLQHPRQKQLYPPKRRAFNSTLIQRYKQALK